MDRTYGAYHLFSGIGGGALGFAEAEAHFRGVGGRYIPLGGVDSDPLACQDFTALVGTPATRLDLFSEADYRAFHGYEPMPDWREATAADMRRSAGDLAPDIIFSSPPCKGFSGLLPKASSESAKYQALNNLTLRGIWLALQAWREDPPGLFLLENVPRITTRGQGLLRQIKATLLKYGYAVRDGYHDCGELGGLGQIRRRYMLVARHTKKVPPFVNQPPQQRLRTIGDVLGPLPLPDDPAGGPMHRMPRLQWKTWVRLALIPAGGDWRDLARLEGQYVLTPEAAGLHTNKYRVTRWDTPAGTVTGSDRLGSGAPAVADYRIPARDARHRMQFRVQAWEEPGATVTGIPNVQAGAQLVADPRLDPAAQKFNHAFKVTPWGEPGGTVTGGAGIIGGSVADPRLGHEARDGSHKVADWDKPSQSVTGSASVTSSNGVGAVADPRLGHEPRKGSYRVQDWNEPAGTITGDPDHRKAGGNSVVADPRFTREPRPGVLEVQPWDQPGHTVTGGKDPNGNMSSVADPRLGCSPRNGAYRVTAWDEPSGAVTGAGDPHAQGAATVADPRIPADDERPDPPPVIIALDGTWHRPLTTWELAALQGFPLVMPDGSPLVLAGKSDRRWREAIGNAVPPPAARAIAEAMLIALLAASAGEQFILSPYGTPVWVGPEELPA